MCGGQRLNQRSVEKSWSSTIFKKLIIKNFQKKNSINYGIFEGKTADYRIFFGKKNGQITGIFLGKKKSITENVQKKVCVSTPTDDWSLLLKAHLTINLDSDLVFGSNIYDRELQEKKVVYYKIHHLSVEGIH